MRDMAHANINICYDHEVCNVINLYIDTERVCDLHHDVSVSEREMKKKVKLHVLSTEKVISNVERA